MTRTTREPVPENHFDDAPCDGCTLGCGSLWRLRTRRGRLLRGAWCGECVMGREAMA